MSKKIKKVANIATFGLAGAAEKLAIDPIKAALGLGSSLGGGGETTGSTVPVAAPDAAPTAQDPAALASREEQKKRQAAYAGMSANVLTKPGGLSGGANTQLKSLLGS